MTPSNCASGLSLLLGTFERERFFVEHWEQRSLHLRHGDPTRFAHLISHESFFETEIRRCAHLKASSRALDGWNQEVRIQPEQALKLFRTGMTICATVLDEGGPCGEVIRAYRQDIATVALPHVNCYYSPDQRGYGLHFDTHPVWILQVAGTKHWTVSFEPAVQNPPFNVVFPPERDRVKLPWATIDRPNVDDPTRFMQVRLAPGDVLYLPAGCWHAARAEGSSLALTLAQARVTTLDLFSIVLGQTATRALPEAMVRLAPYPRGGQRDGGARETVRTRLGDDLRRLKEVVGRIDADALVQLYEFLDQNPEALLARRQLSNAKAQVGLMKAQQSAREALEVDALAYGATTDGA